MSDFFKFKTHWPTPTTSVVEVFFFFFLVPDESG